MTFKYLQSALCLLLAWSFTAVSGASGREVVHGIVRGFELNTGQLPDSVLAISRRSGVATIVTHRGIACADSSGSHYLVQGQTSVQECHRKMNLSFSTASTPAATLVLWRRIDVMVGGRAYSLVSSKDSVLVKTASEPARGDALTSNIQIAQEVSYFGGLGNESITGIEYSADGNALYVCGTTTSAELFPTIAGYRRNSRDKVDAFCAKLNRSHDVEWVAIFGGSAEDIATAVTLNSKGEPVVVGYTNSLPSTFPLTSDAFDPNLSLGDTDGFVVRLSSNGEAIIAASFFGGSGDDRINAVVCRGDTVVIAGSSESSQSIPGAQVGTRFGFGQDAFVSALEPALVAPPRSIVLGGSRSDEIRDLVSVDEHLYVYGSTASDNLFPAGQNSEHKGGIDVFAARFTWPDLGFERGSYYGTSGNDVAARCAISPNGLHLAGVGWTDSREFPSTAPPIGQPIGAGPHDDAFAIVVDRSFRLVHSRMIRGNSSDRANDVDFLGSNALIVGGLTTSPNFPETSIGLEHAPNSGIGQDGFIAALSLVRPFRFELARIGGTGSDEIGSVTVSSDMDVSIAGSTLSREASFFGKTVRRPVVGGEEGFVVSLALPAQIELSSQILNFGQPVAVGSDTSIRLIVRNSGFRASPLTYELLVNPGAAFAVDRPLTTIVLDPGDSVVVPVAFRPNAPVPYQGILELRLTGDTAQVALQGIGARSLLKFQPTSLDFGDVEIGRDSTASVAIINRGNLSGVVSEVRLEDGRHFRVNVLRERVIGPGDTLWIDVQYAPLSAAQHGDELRLFVRGETEVGRILLSGNGRARIDISPRFVAFPNTFIGADTDTLLTIRNQSVLRLVVNSVGTLKAPFGVSTAFPLEIPSQESRQIRLSFKPTQDIALNDTLVLSTNVGRFLVPVRGRGLRAPLQIDPERLEFSSTEIGATRSKIVNLRVQGSQAVFVDSIVSTSRDFRARDSKVVVQLNSLVQVTVDFTPRFEKRYSDTLSLFTRGIVYKVPLSGEGVSSQSRLQISPNPIFIDSAYVGSTTTVGVRLTNTGSTAVELTSVVVEYEGAVSPFSVSPLVTSKVLAANSIETVQLLFVAQRAGSDSAILRVRGPGTDLSVPIRTISREPGLHISIPANLSGRTGETVFIPVVATRYSLLASARRPSTLEVVVSVNATVATTVENSNLRSWDSNNRRYFEANTPVLNLREGDTVLVLPMQLALGDAVETTIRIDSVRWRDEGGTLVELPTIVTHGKLVLTDLWWDGDKVRLLDSIFGAPSIEVWPSPTQSGVNVRIENIGSGATLQIVDARGVLMQSVPVGGLVGTYELAISLPGFFPGRYYVILHNGTYRKAIPFVILP